MRQVKTPSPLWLGPNRRECDHERVTPRKLQPALTRRRFLGGAAGLSAAGLLAACGSNNGDRTPTPAPTASATPPATPATSEPTAAATLPANLDTMIGQMIMLGFRGTTVDDSTPIAADLIHRHIGSVVLFDFDVASGQQGRNISSPDQVAGLCSSLSALSATPLLIAADQEGGLVQRLGPRNGFDAIPSPEEVGAGEDVAYAALVGAQTAGMLAAAGVNWNLAPVVDVNVNPTNPIIGDLGRSYSADPTLVASLATAVVDAHRARGILTCLKHFPGHGSSTGDSHLGFVDVTDTWIEDELIPYQAMVAAGAADTVMAAHVFNERLDPTYPASLSHATITTLLRETLGFDGVVVSDDLGMGAITQEYGFEEAIELAVLAGTDVLAFANNLTYDADLGAKVHGTLRTLVEAGTIPVARIEQSYARVMALKGRLA